jgi:hypothetical protein
MSKPDGRYFFQATLLITFLLYLWVGALFAVGILHNKPVADSWHNTPLSEQSPHQHTFEEETHDDLLVSIFPHLKTIQTILNQPFHLQASTLSLNTPPQLPPPKTN